VPFLFKVGSYHASSLFVATRPPTAGVVSRGIGVEGISTVLAGLWGTGVGSGSVTENVHTIAVTKMGSRRAVGFGAILLVVFSIVGKGLFHIFHLDHFFITVFFLLITITITFVGKVGALIASIPEVMVAALLCFMWAMLCALGLSNLRYSATGSSRNSIIVGLALFLSLSIPSYFQQYGVRPGANSSVPTYFQPYNVASHGPVHTGSGGVCIQIVNHFNHYTYPIHFFFCIVIFEMVFGHLCRRLVGFKSWKQPLAEM
jgi:xanthine/uracil permease